MSMFSTAFGCSYTINAVKRLVWSDYAGSPKYSTTVQISMFVAGVGVLLAYAFSRKVELGSVNQWFTLNHGQVQQEIGRRRTKLALFAMVSYYGFVSSITFELTGVCTEPMLYRSQSAICFGVAFALVSLVGYVKGKRDPAYTAVFAALIVSAFIIYTVLLPDTCARAPSLHMDDVKNSSLLLPIAAIFLGGGSGLLICDLLALLSTAGGNEEWRYASLQMSQAAWVLGSYLAPPVVFPRIYLAVGTVLTALYLLPALYLHSLFNKRDVSRKATQIRKDKFRYYAPRDCSSGLQVTFNESIVQGYYQ